MALAWLAGAQESRLPPGVHEVPAEIDTEIATLALAARDVGIDALTPATPEPLPPAIPPVRMAPWKFACQANIGAMSPEKRGST